eukprot:Ihof_evm7s229 gene=Ihof_evmTU7s229
MACTVLKQYVKTHWTSISENFKQPETTTEVMGRGGEGSEGRGRSRSEVRQGGVVSHSILWFRAHWLFSSLQVKEMVRQALPRVLHDPVKQIRTNAAAAMSSVASWDWPEQWPGLLDYLLDCIKPGASAVSVDGGLRVFAELASELTDTQLPKLVPILLPGLLHIITSPPEGLGASSISRCIDIFTDCLTMAFTMDQPQLVEPHFATWIPILGQAIHSSAASYEVRVAALSASTELVRNFDKKTKEMLAKCILPAVWEGITGHMDVYVKDVVNGSEDSGYNSDGEAMGCEAFVYGLFDFVTKMVEKKSMKAALGPTLATLLYHVIAYMQVTQNQLEGWEDDANKFVHDEDDEGLSYSVRISAVDLLQVLGDTLGTTVLEATYQAARTHLEQGMAARANGDPNWWKISEASLVALGHMSDLVEDDSQGELSTLLRTVYSQHLTNCNSPFLQGRALWLASRYAKLAEASVILEYLGAAVSALQPQHPAPVRILALRAVYYFCGHLEPEALKPYMDSVFENIGFFVREASEELLVLVVEVATIAAKVNPQITAAHEAQLSPIAIAVWIKCPNDPLIVAAVEGLVVALSQTPCLPNLTARAVPTLVSFLQAPPDRVPHGVVASAVEMLQTLVRNTPAPLPTLLVNTAFPALVTALLATDDHEVLQNGCEALTMYLTSGVDQLVAGNGIEGIVNVIAKVLALESDSAAVFVGRLISKLIRKVPLGPVVEPLLQAVLSRLLRASMLSLEQALVAVYGQLMLSDLNQTITLLENTAVEGHSGLTVLMNKWTENQPNFHGRYDVNSTIMALCRLLDSGLPILSTVIVKGQRLVSPEEQGVIRTRSRAKLMQEQYSQVPLCLKIFQLLANEFIDQMQRDEEKEWEDEDEEDDDDSENPFAQSGSRPSPFAPAEDYAFLSDVIGQGLEDDEEEDSYEDPELLNDELYKLDLK